jgi:hypothetical protein
MSECIQRGWLISFSQPASNSLLAFTRASPQYPFAYGGPHILCASQLTLIFQAHTSETKPRQSTSAAPHQRPSHEQHANQRIHS